MAEQIQKFRSALGGFNREDVVQFIQSITARHETELNELRDDNRRLENARQAQEAESGALKAEIAKLQAALTESQAKLNEAAAQAPQCPDWKGEELAAYRRAEEVERQSRERAAQLHNSLTALIADASVQMDESSAALSEVMERLNADLMALRSAMDGGKAVLSDTAASLRASGAAE